MMVQHRTILTQFEGILNNRNEKNPQKNWTSWFNCKEIKTQISIIEFNEILIRLWCIAPWNCIECQMELIKIVHTITQARTYSRFIQLIELVNIFSIGIHKNEHPHGDPVCFGLRVKMKNKTNIQFFSRFHYICSLLFYFSTMSTRSNEWKRKRHLHYRCVTIQAITNLSFSMRDNFDFIATYHLVVDYLIKYCVCV